MPTNTDEERAAAAALAACNLTAFPGEIFQAPRSWVQIGYPTLMYYIKPARGGHFGA